MFKVQNVQMIIRVLTVIILMNLANPFARAEAVKATSLLSFAEWKQNTQSDIQKKMKSIQQKISDRKDAPKKVIDNSEQRQNAEVLASQLRFEKLKFQASEELSFHEYFVGYLLLQKDFDQKISEISKTLKPDEVKELMALYGELLKKRDNSGKHGYAPGPLDE